mmetsp:Transcript_21954/g.70934  ORF Transcript_21954/g.70934 Transcript_21954/m.70934 type:complete len:209 (+) Transcript_21954:789-1415(+)
MASGEVFAASGGCSASLSPRRMWSAAYLVPSASSGSVAKCATKRLGRNHGEAAWASRVIPTQWSSAVRSRVSGRAECQCESGQRRSMRTSERDESSEAVTSLDTTSHDDGASSNEPASSASSSSVDTTRTPMSPKSRYFAHEHSSASPELCCAASATGVTTAVRLRNSASASKAASEARRSASPVSSPSASEEYMRYAIFLSSGRASP